MINKRLVTRHFNVMSHSYETYAQVQKKMAVSLLQQTEVAGKFTKILEIGCGTGYLTRQLAATFPQADILATDIAPGMLRTAKATLADYTNIRYALADGENLKLDETFDLIISNAALQWFNDYARAYTGFLAHLQPGGYLLYGTFGPRTFRELHASFQAARETLNLHSTARHGLSFAPAAALQQLMTELGYEKTAHSEEYHQEYFPSVREFLSAIKKTGANNASRENPLINRRLMFSMMRHYEENYCANNQIYATYHVVYGCGRKPPEHKQ